MFAPIFAAAERYRDLLVFGQYTVALVLAGQHLDLRRHLFNLPPLERETKHATQDFKNPVDAADLKSSDRRLSTRSVIALGGIASSLLLAKGENL